MRKPNGYGGIIKLSGNRRKPYAVRFTRGYQINGNAKYEYLGTYKTYEDANLALVKYHENPNDVPSDITFEQLFQKMADRNYTADKISESTRRGYYLAYDKTTALHAMVFCRLKTNHLQDVIDKCGAGSATKKKIKLVFGQMYKFAMMNDIVEKNYADYTVVKTDKSKRSIKGRITDAHIDTLWKDTTSDGTTIVLMLIYSGLRISELLALKNTDINLEQRWFDIKSAKTTAGIRRVPIAKRVLPFFEHWVAKKGRRLICQDNGASMLYDYCRDHYIDPVLKPLDKRYTPHWTRHTCISKLVEAGTTPSIIKDIVGHESQKDLYELVYTHLNFDVLLDAIDQI